MFLKPVVYHPMFILTLLAGCVVVLIFLELYLMKLDKEEKRRRF